MEKTLKLRIVSPDGERLCCDAEHVRLSSPVGSFGVLPGHAHMLSSVTAGEIIYDDADGRHSVATTGGIAEITGHSVTVLE